MPPKVSKASKPSKSSKESKESKESKIEIVDESEPELDEVSDTDQPDDTDVYVSDYDETPAAVKEDVDEKEDDTIESEKGKDKKPKKVFNPLLALERDDDDDEGEDGLIEWDESENLEIEEQIKVKEKIYKIITPNDRQSSDYLSKPECARLIGDRTRHIDNGAQPYIDITGMTSSMEIAYNELLQKKIPMGVIRHIGSGYVEIWHMWELNLPRLPPLEFFL